MPMYMCTTTCAAVCVCCEEVSVQHFSTLRSRQRREAAILLQQVVASERDIRHAAWGARKEIRARIRAVREEGKVEGEGGRECVY